VSSSKNPTQGTQRKGPETLLALRDSLINDLRSNHEADQASESSGEPDEIPEEFHDSPGITAAEPPNDLTPRQGNLPSNEVTSHCSGVTPLEPPIEFAAANFARNAVTADSTSLTLAQTDLNAKLGHAPTTEDSHGVPSFVAEESSRAKPSFARQALRTVAGGLFIIAIIGTGLTLLSFRQDRPWDRALSWLSSVFPGATGSSAPHNRPVTAVSDFAVMQRQIDALADRQDRIMRDIATRQDQLDKAVNDFAVVGRQVNELAGGQDQITRDIATRQVQLKTMVSDIAVVRRQVEELAAKQDQMAASTATRQDQLRTTISDVAAVRRQLEQLTAKQDQIAGTVAARQDQLKTMANDFAAMRRQIEELAAKPDQMAGIAMPQDQLKTMLSDIAALRRQAEELAAKQDQLAQEIANLQATERSLSQKIASVPQYRTVRNRSHRKAR
jgi:uncharacterized protein YoxC